VTRVLTWRRGLALPSLLVLAVAAGCYNPSPKDGAFKCDSADGYLCPAGLRCDVQRGLCVHELGGDMALAAIGGGGDGGAGISLPACDVRVRAGHFANPKLLALSTSGDDAHLALNSDGSKLVFSANGTPTLASIGSDPHDVSGAQALTVASAPAGFVFLGGAFGKDGSFWLSGLTTAGAMTTTQLYAATLAGSTLTVGMAHAPASHCAGFPLADPVFVGFDPGGELLAAGPLASCTLPSYVVSGALDHDFGTFVAAVGAPGFGAPSLTPSGLTLLTGTLGAGGTLHFATRGATNTQFNGADLVPQGSALGTGTRDVQLVVHPGCSVAYLVSQRPGGAGGLDLWSLDITP
jgi:hypothetical protein